MEQAEEDELEDDDEEDEAVEDDEPDEDEYEYLGPFMLGKVVQDLHRWDVRRDRGFEICLADKTQLWLLNTVTLRGDQGRGFLALIGATLDDVDFQLDAITLKFSGGATMRLGLAPEDYDRGEPDAMQYYDDATDFAIGWEDGTVRP
jgi:hypothetical protein